MKIYDLLVKAQRGDKESCYAILEKFERLTKKYSRKLSYEDAEQDVICYFIELIYTFPLEKFREDDEGKIVVYITKCIYHEYVRLLKQIVLQKSEVNYSSISEEQLHVLELRNSGKDCYEQLFFSELRLNLDEKEWEIIQKVYIEGKTVSQIAKEKGISRQAVNQMKNRALRKLRNYYEER